MAVHVALAAAVASAPGSPANRVVGAPAVAASAARITMRDDLTVVAGAMRDDLTVVAGAADAVATMRRSISRCPGTVGVSQ
jgi:hypothetical protein